MTMEWLVLMILSPTWKIFDYKKFIITTTDRIGRMGLKLVDVGGFKVG